MLDGLKVGVHENIVVKRECSRGILETQARVPKYSHTFGRRGETRDYIYPRGGCANRHGCKAMRHGIGTR